MGMKRYMAVVGVLLGAQVLYGVPVSSALEREPLSLNFQDVEVRTVLQVLADFSGVNLVASDAVQGKVTLRLHEVPWQQALDLVLRSKGLEKRMEGNVLLVVPAGELAGQDRRALEDRQYVAALQPTHQALLPVHYAQAADIASVFQSLAADDPFEPTQGMISVDERTNTLIVRQTPERLEQLRQLIASLDVPVRQVMIEARIVEANVDYEKNLGVRWGGEFQLGGGLTVGGGAIPSLIWGHHGRHRSSAWAWCVTMPCSTLNSAPWRSPAMARSSPSPKWSPPTRKPRGSSRAPRCPIRKPVAVAPPR